MAHKDAGVSLADIYAEALYDAAKAAGELPRIQLEMEAFLDGITADAKLLLFLDSPVIPFEDKRRAIESALSGFHRITLNFLLVVVERVRVELISHIARAFRDHGNRQAGIAEFLVATAQPLEPESARRLKEMIAGQLKDRTVRLEQAVRPELLGGMVLEHEGFRWNWSLARRLRRLVTQMKREQSGEALWVE